MRYPVESMIDRVRKEHKELLVRPIDFVAAPNAIIPAEYKTLEVKHKEAIDAMMRDATFMEKIKQLLVPSSAAAASIVTPLITMNPLVGPTVAALSAAMAGATFNLIYHQMEIKKQGRVYLNQLNEQVAQNEAYSTLIKKSFDSMAEEMLRAFCLREIRLKEHHDNDTRKTINEDYLSFLVNMLNQNIMTIYGQHQIDIKADANRWWLWKLIDHHFRSQEERKTTTQAIQIGLLEFVAKFHADIADEKTWVGKHTFRFTIYAAISGTVLGLAATLFIPSLVTLFWPVLTAAIGGGVVFAAGAYSYAKAAQFKREAIERDAHHKFGEDVLKGKEDLKRRLLKEDSLNEADVNALQEFQSISEKGYFGNAYIAVGAPSSWLRTFAKHYAHSKMVENDFAPTIKKLVSRADEQTSDLIKSIKENPGKGLLGVYIARFWSQTKSYIIEAKDSPEELPKELPKELSKKLPVGRKYELVEKTKEQLLEAISRVGNIQYNIRLNEFFKELYGNDDQLELAQKFCPSANAEEQDDSCYNALLEKANGLANEIRTKAMFVGSEDYWQALGIEPPLQQDITAGNIDDYLSASRQFLRQISPPVERGHETEATHSEAYYLYRTLLMRQFARLLHENKVNEESAAKIKHFIEGTLHATKLDMVASVDDVLADIYYHEIEKPTTEELAADQRKVEAYPSAQVKNVEYVARAMRIDLAYHPIVSPAERLEQCIKGFMALQGVTLVLGNTDPEVLQRFNFDSNPNIIKDVNAFIDNSRLLLNKLKEPPMMVDTWNTSPVDLHYAYKEVLTRQTLFTLKSLVQALARCNPEADGVRIAELREAIRGMQGLLLADCFELDVSLGAQQYINMLAQKCQPDTTDIALVNFAKSHHHFFKLNEIVEGDIQVVIPAPSPAFADLQRNLKLSKTKTIDVSADTVLINYTPGRDAQPPEAVNPNVVKKSTIHSRLASFFVSLTTPATKQVRPVTQLERHKANIAPYSSYFSKDNNVAKGTPEAWQRIYDSSEANGSMTEADGTAIKELKNVAHQQTTRLIAELKECKNDQVTDYLLSYIEETTRFLDSPGTAGSVERYKYIEQAKAQLLTAISTSGIEVVPGQVISFIADTLGGNTDQVFLAQHFCPNQKSDEDALFNSLLKKARQLADVIKRENAKSPIFIGDKSYWQMLGVDSIGDQTPQEINKDTVKALLNNSKILLRKLGQPVAWGDTKECEHTEAYYLYRTLLMRQFAILIHEKQIDETSRQEITSFIANTFHANPDVILDDVYHYGRDLLANAALVAGAMQLNLAYHPAISPVYLMDKCIETYVEQTARELFVFGDPREKVLLHLNPILNAAFAEDIARFINDTTNLLDKLSKPALVGDNWNDASVDLYYAYKHTVTKQTVFTLKAILKAISQDDGSRVLELKQAYSKVYEFLNGYCYEIKEDNEAKIIIDLFKTICTDEKQTEQDVIKQARTYHSRLDLDAIYKREYVQARQDNRDFSDVQANTVLSVVQEADITKSMVSIEHTPGTDLAAILKERREARAAQAHGPHAAMRIFNFFTSMLSTTPPVTPVKNAEFSKT